jgi:hypothetical protein
MLVNLLIFLLMAPSLPWKRHMVATSVSSFQLSGGLTRGGYTVHLPRGTKRSKLKMCQRGAPGRRKEQLGMRNRISDSLLSLRLSSKRSSPLMKRFGLPANPGSTIATKLCPSGEINPIHQEEIKDSQLSQLIRIRFAKTSSWMMITLPHHHSLGGDSRIKNHQGPPDTQLRSSVTTMCTLLMKILSMTAGIPIKCANYQLCRSKPKSARLTTSRRNLPAQRRGRS